MRLRKRRLIVSTREPVARSIEEGYGLISCEVSRLPWVWPRRPRNLIHNPDFEVSTKGWTTAAPWPPMAYFPIEPVVLREGDAIKLSMPIAIRA